MRIKKIVTLLLLPYLLSAQIENSNFTISQKDILYNYNRLRIKQDYSYNNFFASFIGDGVNYYGQEYIDSISFEYLKQLQSDTPFETQTGFKNYGNGEAYAKIYRLYGGWEDNQNRIVLGLQNISMGVGRIWTPTNIFNPKNSYALEPDELFGVMALSYSRNLNNTSHIEVVTAQKENHNFKSAISYKSFWDIADFGLDIINSDNTKMIGYEIEGNLADTGVELRSEGAYIDQDDNKFTQIIIGGDYGFKSGTTVIAEILYSSKLFNSNDDITANMVSSNFSTAISLSKTFNIFLDGSLTYITTIDNPQTHFINPILTYTLNDYNSFSLGALFYHGDIFSEIQDTYYFRYELSF